MKVELRTRTVGELLGLTFSLIATHFFKLIVIGFAFTLPMLLVDLVTNTPTTSNAAMFAALALLLLQFVLMPIQQAATILIVAGSFTDRNPSVEECFRAALGRFFPIVALSLVTGIIMFLGLLFLIVPGIMFWTWYFCAGPALVVERIGFADAMGRSTRLSEGRRWRILGFGLLLGIIVAIIESVATRVIAVGADSLFVASLLGWIVSTIAGLFMVVGPVAMYFNLRVEKDAYDLESIGALVDAIGARRRR